METTEWKMQIRCHVVSLWRLRQTIHEITRNGTKLFGVVRVISWIVL